jgi:hypothetical protein
MKIFDRLFGKSPPPPDLQLSEGDPLVIVPIPPLVTMLFRLEKDKGSPLTREEVLAARDSAVCMTMLASHRDQLAQRRGYDDVDLDRVWEEWLVVRAAEDD